MQPSDLFPQWPSKLFSNNSDSLETLTDGWIWVLIVLTAAFGVIWVCSYFFGLSAFRRHQKVLKTVTLDSFEAKRGELCSKKYPLHQRWERSLLAVGDGPEKRLYQTAPPQEIYHESELLGWHGPVSAFSKNIPALLIAAGILGTFVGLTLGLGSVFPAEGGAAGAGEGELENNIVGLISGCTTAFKTSVWGVGLSILATILLKLGDIYGRERSLNGFFLMFGDLLPFYHPENALHALSESSKESEKILKTLGQEIGAKMQTAVKGLADAVANGAGEHSKEAGRQLKDGLIDELGNISNVINKLVGVVQLSVKHLKGQEEVIKGFDKAATKLKQGADELSPLGKAFADSSSQNLQAANAQKAASQINMEVVKKFEPVPEMIKDASSGLAHAGTAMREGAGALSLSLKQIQEAQKKWNEGIEIGLKGLQKQIEQIIKSYGYAIDEQTRGLLTTWSKEVEVIIKRFAGSGSGLNTRIQELSEQLKLNSE